MRTIRIFIGRPKAEGHPLRLFAQDARPDWNEKPLAEAWIPLDLSVPNPPLHPLDGTPLEAAGLRTLLLSERGVSESFKAIGSYLYQLLQQGDVGTAWKDLRQKFKAEGLRTVLDIESEDDPASKQEDLRRLPWELMTDGPTRLYTNSKSTLIRGPVRFDAVAPKENWPLRALVVIACPKDDPIQAEKEQYAIEHAFQELGRQMDVEYLVRMPQSKVADRLTKFKPHLFHFIGHARAAENTSGAVLVFYREDTGKEEEWDVDTLLTHLGTWQPRFVFLNACRSADPTGQAQSYALSDAFRIAGVPAVIGMQGDIDGMAAATLSETLYLQLSEGVPLDVALGEARRKVVENQDGGNGLKRRDWALPILHLDVPPEQVLPMKFEDYAKAEPIVSTITQFADHRPYIGRNDIRRLLWQCSDPWMPDYKPKKLLIITGEAKVGKSALALWCLEGCAYRGIPLQYVNIRGNGQSGTKDYLEVLRSIRDGDKVSDKNISAPLPAAAFRLFNWQLNHWLQDKEPTVPPPDGDVTDLGIPWTKEISKDTGQKICRSFLLALEDSVRLQGNTPFLLALDQMSIRDDHFVGYLLPELIAPMVSDSTSRIRLILIATDEQYRDFQLSSIEHLGHREPIGRFSRKETETLLLEFCRAIWHPLRASEVTVMTAVALAVETDWVAKEGFDAAKSSMRFLRGK